MLVYGEKDGENETIESGILLTVARRVRGVVVAACHSMMAGRQPDA